jgi:uncharacterized surface protein with fasciclin (FAS1) repeats
MHASCTHDSAIDPGFKELEKYTIYDYVVTNEKDYSSFLQILKASGMDKTLSAYNPGGKTKGVDYTLFLPDNAAVDEFIRENNQYASLEDLLNDQSFVNVLAKYHILNGGVASNEFPFGTFNQPTLSNDFLNVNFDIHTDTTFYSINNQARIIKANIEANNGYIQVIGSMLKPITLNSYGWLKKNSAYSLFTAAMEATGIDKIINVNMKEEGQTLQPFTVLVEADSIFHKRNVNNFDDLVKMISPERTDYTNSTNPLNIFVGYHLLTGSHFLDDIAKNNTNYNNFADIPLKINGKGMEIVINKNPNYIFIDEKNDTTDYIGLYYDASNVNTQSGPIHFINQILMPRIPTRAEENFEFYDEPYLAEYRRIGGKYIIENPSLLNNVTWTGAKLSYVKSMDVNETSWSKDYLQIEGDFTITYNVPKIIQGKYDVYLQADGYNVANALVEVYIDGNKLGGLIDLTKGGNANSPFYAYKLGSVDFKKYSSHAVQIRTLIPGRLKWDLIRFSPI